MLKLKCKKGGEHTNPADFEVLMDGKKIEGLTIQSISVFPGKKVVKAMVSIFDSSQTQQTQKTGGGSDAEKN